MFRKIQVLFIYVISCSTAQAADMSVNTASVKEVTLTLKEARFKRPLFNCSYNQIGLAYAEDAKPNNKNDEFLPVISNLDQYSMAKYEDQLYVTNLQARHKELPQYPILLLTSGKDTALTGIGPGFLCAMGLKVLCW